MKPHTLAEPVEKAINLKDATGKSLLLQIYDQIRDAGVYTVKVGDRVLTITEEQVRDMFRSSNRNERKAAYTAFLERFQKKAESFVSLRITFSVLTLVFERSP